MTQPMLLLHGDNQVLSRSELNSIILAAKNSQKEIIRLSGKSLQQEELIQALESDSLFSQERLVIIEELFSQPKSKKQEEITEYLSTPGVDKETPGVNVIFWEKKTINTAQIKKLSFITQTKIFKIPVIVFKLVESIFPNNQKQTLTHLKELLKNESVELAFYMIARQIKLLIQAKDNVFPKMAPWMLGKLKNQAGKFKSIIHLQTLYKNLLEIDRNIKTGATPMDLSWHLDWWLINNLE